MKRKLLYIPTRASKNGEYFTMLVPWDYVQELIAELAKKGISPIILGDEMAPEDLREITVDGVNVCLEEIVVYPLQLEE